MVANVQTMAYHGELPEQRLDRAWFGGGADIKLKALEKATELAATWQ